MTGSLAEERGERRDGVEGRVAIIVLMGSVDAVTLCCGICVEFRRFVYNRQLKGGPLTNTSPSNQPTRTNYRLGFKQNPLIYPQSQFAKSAANCIIDHPS